MNRIEVFSELSETRQFEVLLAIKEIFFLSTSKKKFDSDEQQEEFFNKWCGDYLKIYPDLFFLVFNSENKLLGYLSGALNTIESLELMRVPGVKNFIHLYKKFPAHLHINFHPDSRGQGIGSLLVKHYLVFLKSRGVLGVHLITSPDALNVSFYERLGFVHTEIYSTPQMELMFMGRLSE